MKTVAYVIFAFRAQYLMLLLD